VRHGSSPEEARRWRGSGREASRCPRAPASGLGLLHGSPRRASRTHRHRQRNSFVTTSSDGGVKVGVMVLELRRAQGVAVEPKASSVWPTSTRCRGVAAAALFSHGGSGGSASSSAGIGRRKGVGGEAGEGPRHSALLCFCSSSALPLLWEDRASEARQGVRE
jgi:hypothetical protein